MYPDGVREVPKVRFRYDLVRELHEISGHVGISRLSQEVRKVYYWPFL